MLKDNTWLKLHRKMLEWEWYDDINVKVLFIHLLLTVNYKDKRWRGVEVKRGSIITSINHLSRATQLTNQQVRSALKKLEMTNEITKQSHANYTVIAVVKFDGYQNDNKRITNEQQTSNKPITNEQQTNNKPITTTKERYKGIEIEREKDNIISKDITQTGIFEDSVEVQEKPKAYGDGDINTCMEYLKINLGASLDGSIKDNRRYCYNLLRRMKKDYPEIEPVESVKMLINVARNDNFHRKNTTGFRYLFYNIQKILEAYKSENGIGEDNSDVYVVC